MGLWHRGLSLRRREGGKYARVARHWTRDLSGTLSRSLGRDASSDTPSFEITEEESRTPRSGHQVSVPALNRTYKEVIP